MVSQTVCVFFQISSHGTFTSGRCKRRSVHGKESSEKRHVRWHKTDEDDREGEYVVAKMMYEPQAEVDKTETSLNAIEGIDIGINHTNSKTAMTNSPFHRCIS